MAKEAPRSGVVKMENTVINKLIDKARNDYLSFKDACSPEIEKAENTINTRGDTRKLMENHLLARGTSGRFYVRLDPPAPKTKARFSYNGHFSDTLKNTIHDKGVTISQYKQVLSREQSIRESQAA